jgi:GTP1/Obg family GTP-binding protein
MTDTTKFEKMIDALDISALPVEEQEELLLDLNSLIFKSSLVRMIENMDEATREEFSVLMEKNPDEGELEAFLLNRVPNAEGSVQEAIETLADDILAVSDID